MKYISIDTETTGLDKNYCQLLSIGAVIEDTENPLPLTEMPQFHCYILHDKIQGEPYALNLNKDIIEVLGRMSIADYPEKSKIRNEIWKSHGIQLLHPDSIVHAFSQFLIDNGIEISDVTVAGKNFTAFDKDFLDKDVPQWSNIRIHRRVLDPATSLTRHTDTVPPNLKQCLERVGIVKEIAHDAVEDAYDVVLVLRHVIK